VAICIAVLFPAAHAFAATTIDADITGDAHWTLAGSPYEVAQSVAVADGATLSIDPGVLVQFEDGVSMGIFGTLAAIGTEMQPIVLAPASGGSAAKLWGGLTFLGDYQQALSHVSISGTTTALDVHAGTFSIDHLACSFIGSCLQFTGGSATISNLSIDHPAGEVVGLLGGSTVTMSDVSISDLDAVQASDLIASYVGSTLSISNLSIDGMLSLPEAITTFIDSSITLDHGSFSQPLQTTTDALSAFSNSTLTLSNTDSIGTGSGNGIEVYGGGTLSLSNAKVSHFASGIATYNSDDTPASTLSLDHTIISNNAIGIEMDGTPSVSVDTLSVHDNPSGGAVYNHENENAISLQNVWWGDASGPHNDASNPGGLGNSVSDDIIVSPWLTEDPFQEVVIPATYYARISVLSQGYANVRDNPSAAATLIKTLPVDYVVHIVSKTNADGTDAIADGYRWYKVEDPTDGSTGWMIAGPDTSENPIYLPYDELARADDIDVATITYDGVTGLTSRQMVILETVDHYLLNTDTAKSLYSSDDKTGNEISDLAAALPKESILAILAQESGDVSADDRKFSNELISYDYGHGIMQLTPNYNYNEAKKTYTQNNPDPLGKYSFVRNEICAGNKNDNYKKCYAKDPNRNDGSKIYDFYNHDPSNQKYKQYANTKQSIYANIKDGLSVLRDKYSYALRSSCKQGNYIVDGETFTCDDLQKIKTIWAYNGVDTTPSNHYLNLVSQKLANLSLYFPGYSYDDSDHLIEKLAIADKHRKEIKVHSPVDLQVVDTTTGETAGLSSDGETTEDIDNSVYDPDTESVLILFPSDNYEYRLVGTDNDSYGFDVANTVGDVTQTVFSASDVPVREGAIHTITLDEPVLEQGGEGATLAIDNDADGTPEETIVSGPVLPDIMPPTIDLSSIADTYVLGERIDVRSLVSDNVSSPDDIVLSATIGETVVPIVDGIITLTSVVTQSLAIRATDATGNQSTATKPIAVHYRFSGISYIPNRSNNEYGAHATIPVGFILSGKNGVDVPVDHPGIDAVRESDGFHAQINPNTSDANGYCDLGEHCFTRLNDMYAFPLKAAKLGIGEWHIVITLGDGSTYTRPILIQ
jgi:hypothetical protein